MTTLAPQQWLALKQSTRDALVKIFKIPRSSFTHVVNNHVETDGYTYEDLKAISLEEMKLLTHSPSENYFEQFELIIKMVESDGATAIASENIPTGAENATPNEPSQESAGNQSGAESGNIPQETVSQTEVLPVSGGGDQVDSGSPESLPDAGNNNSASVDAKDEKVQAEKPGTDEANRSGTRGRKKS